ncbi:MAG: MFS transporter [Candidatus Omnitrophota bacterium]
MLKNSKKTVIRIFISINAIYFFSYFQRVAVPGTIFNELQISFLTSASAVAALGTIFYFIYGGMQFFVGITADRIGANRILLAGGAVLTIGSIFFSLSRSLPVLYINRGLVGLGSSLIYVSIVKKLDGLFDNHNFPLFLGLSTALGYSGGLFGTLPFERTVRLFGWRTPMMVLSILCLLPLMHAFFLLKKSERVFQQKKNGFSLRYIRNIIRNKNTVPLIFCHSTNFSAYFLFQAVFGKKFLQDFYQLTSGTAAAFTFTMMSITIFSLLSSGFLSRVIGRRKPILIFASGLTFFTLVLFTIALACRFSSAWFLFGYTLLAVSTGSSPVSITLMKELNPVEAAATAVGFLNGIAYLSVAMVTSLAGAGLDFFRSAAIKTGESVIYPSQAYLSVFIGCLALTAISFYASFFISESCGKSAAAGNKTDFCPR